MRTIKIATFAALIITALPLNAQDTTKPFYFPNKTGDMWEYFYFEFGTSDVDTVQNFIVSDSIDSKGIIHITQKARRINPDARPLILWDSVQYWIDTVNNFVYGRGSEIGFDSLLVYKLDASQGEQWVMEIHPGTGYIYEMARVINKGEGTIFGKETTIMQIEYYLAPDTSDTTGLGRYTDEIADGFGLIFRAYAEYSGEIHLIGTVINNILYGDTTIVSVQNEEYFLPLSIKLNQNYPNPFNSETRIEFSVPKQGYVSLKVYDILGKLVKILMDNEIEAGWHQVFFKAENLSGGVYFYTLQINGTQETKKMIFLP
jgi:hypothetical protein